MRVVTVGLNRIFYTEIYLSVPVFDFLPDKRGLTVLNFKYKKIDRKFYSYNNRKSGIKSPTFMFEKNFFIFLKFILFFMGNIPFLRSLKMINF